MPSCQLLNRAQIFFHKLVQYMSWYWPVYYFVNIFEYYNNLEDLLMYYFRNILMVINLSSVVGTKQQGAVLSFAPVTGTTPIAAALLLGHHSPDLGILPGAVTAGY